MNLAEIQIEDGTENISTYFSSAKVDSDILALAKSLKTVQATLDYVTNIPYKVHNFRAREPMETVKRNYGDCDDKSNLLASLLTALEYENYIVLVPKHAFVIINVEKKLPSKRALHFQGKDFYILESTSKNSKIGFRFDYKLSEIDAIIDPLKREVLDTGAIEYF